jgi:hypothetical protein
MTQFTVDPATLRAHASAVSGVAQMVDTAAAAGTQVGLGGDAYGVLIAPLMQPLLSHLLPNTVQMVQQAAQLGDAIVAGLKANSDVYQDVEDAIAEGLKAVEK